MDKPCHIQVKLELGHKAEIRKKPTPEGFTHDWSVFVRGPGDKNISSFIEKVVFHLHESFHKPKRAIKEPPYQLKECGYGTFELPIDIYFKNKEEPKKITFNYELFLQLDGSPPINHVRCEKLTFQNPTAEFRKRLLKAGGELLNVHQPGDQSEHSEEELSTSPHSSPVHQPTMAQVHSAKPLPLPSTKNPAMRTVPMAAVKPLQQHVSQETTTKTSQPVDNMESQPFTELFGTPVKLENIKKSKSSSSSKESSSKHSSKESSKHAKKRSSEGHNESSAKKHKSKSESHDEHRVKKDKSEKKSKSKKEHSTSSKDGQRSHSHHKKSSSHSVSLSGSSSSSASSNKESPRVKPDLPPFNSEVCTISDDDDDSWDEQSMTSETFGKQTPSSPFSDISKNVVTKSPSGFQPHRSPVMTNGIKISSPTAAKTHKLSIKSSPKPDSTKHANKSPSDNHKIAKKKEKSKGDDYHSSSKSLEKKPLTSVMAEFESDDDGGPEVKVKREKKEHHKKHADKSEKKDSKHKREHKHSKDKKSSKNKSEEREKSKSPKAEEPAIKDCADINPPDKDSHISETVPQDVEMKSAKAPNGAVINELMELHRQIQLIQNREQLKKVASVIAETGLYSVGKSTFDFDLCSLTPDTIRKVKSFLK